LRSLTKIFCGALLLIEFNRHLVQIALRRDLAQELLQGTSQGDLAHDLLQTSSHSAEFDLVSLLLTTMFALVLLACSH